MNVFILIAIVIICLAIGFLVGMLVTGYRRESPEADQSGRKNTQEHADLLSPLPPPAPPFVPDAAPSIIPPLTNSKTLDPIIPPDIKVPQSMVEQINDILQKDLESSPLRDMFIKISELPEGVVVWVGNQSYPGVDAIPPGPARDLVQAAVRKWELK